MKTGVLARPLCTSILVALTVVNFGAGCRGIRCDGVTRVKADYLSTTLSGAATFFTFDDTAQWDDKQRVRLRLAGTAVAADPAKVKVYLKQIVIMDDSGTDAFCPEPCDVLLSIPWPKNRWQSQWIESDWDGGATYGVTVRYLYDVEIAGTTTHHFQDIGGQFTGIQPFQSKAGGFPALTPGQTITNQFASGNFMSTQGMALYDVRVDYALASGDPRTVVSIEFFAAPHGTAGFPQRRHCAYLESVPPQPIAGGAPVVWQHSGIHGPYVPNADPTKPTDYDCEIWVNYSDNSKDVVNGTFTNIPPASATNPNPVTLTPH